MPFVVLTCVTLIAGTTLIHYEMLYALNARLDALVMPKRSKLLVVIFGAFLAHALEITVYAMAFYLLMGWSASFAYISMERFWTGGK